jgi:hypothetical protein
MPIRFACPHCRQRLSVSTRKAGATADCPRCKRSLAIPPPAPDGTIEKEDADGLTGSFLVAEPIAHPAIEAPTAIALGGAANGAEESSSHARQPVSEATIDAPAVDDAAAVDLVEDIAADRAEPRAPPIRADFIVVPRYVIYTQGALLAAVALTAFVIGVLLGSTFGSAPAVAPVARECVVSGSVSYTTGPRSRPDRGAVIALIPASAEAAGERAPVSGLRPSDPPPATEHRGLGVIRQLGGNYTRADANGRFETRLPAAGRYWLLVISHAKRVRSAAETKSADVRKLSRYFDNAADLLEDRRYQLSEQTIRGDEQLTIAFD